MPKIGLPKISMPKISMPRMPHVSEAYNAGIARSDLAFRLNYARQESEEDKQKKEDLSAKLAQNEESRKNYNFLEKAVYDFGYTVMNTQIRSIEKGMNKTRRTN